MGSPSVWPASSKNAWTWSYAPVNTTVQPVSGKLLGETTLNRLLSGSRQSQSSSEQFRSS